MRLHCSHAAAEGSARRPICCGALLAGRWGPRTPCPLSVRLGQPLLALLPPPLLQEEREQFKLDRFLMVVRAYADPSLLLAADDAPGSSKDGGKVRAVQQQHPSKKQKKQKGAGDAVDAAAGVVHFLPEAECYQAAADWSFAFPVADRLVGKDELQPCRVVMLVGAAGVAAARKQLAALMAAAGQ